MCRMLSEMIEENANLAAEYGEKFAYLCKGAFCLSKCIKSCFAYKRDNSFVSDTDITLYDKSAIITVLNRAVDSTDLKYQSSTRLRQFEVDIASMIIFLVMFLLN